NQGIELTRRRHTLHELEGVIGHAEAEVGISSRKTRQAQNPDGVLYERLGDVPEQARLQVPTATIRVDDFPGAGFGHGVAGETTAFEILLQGDLWRKLRREAPVAQAYFALETRERVLLVSLRMQKNREFAPDRHEPVTLELFRARTDDDPIALVHRPPE